jgi:hypothetical protein
MEAIYWLVGWLVGHHLLIRDLGPCGIIIMNLWVDKPFPWYGDYLLLRDFLSCGITFVCKDESFMGYSAM